MMISDQRTFVLDRFLVTVNRDCLLVEVKERDGEEPVARVQDLPDWIFYSEHTLWLTEEEKPLRDRVRDGERIRQSLLQEFRLTFAD